MSSFGFAGAICSLCMPDSSITTISPAFTSRKNSAPMGGKAQVSDAMIYPPFKRAILSGRMPHWSRSAISFSLDIIRIENAPIIIGYTRFIASSIPMSSHMHAAIASTIMRESENSDESIFCDSRNSFNASVVGKLPLCTSAIAPSSGPEQSETESLRLGGSSAYDIFICLRYAALAASIGWACFTFEPPAVGHRNARAFLPTMLERVQPKEGEPRDIEAFAINPEHCALFAEFCHAYILTEITWDISFGFFAKFNVSIRLRCLNCCAFIPPFEKCKREGGGGDTGVAKQHLETPPVEHHNAGKHRRGDKRRPEYFMA